MLRRLLNLAAAALVLAAVASETQASSKGRVQLRPIEDLLATQGQSVVFVPPVPDYVGWVGGDFINFALIDYAGLADAYIEAETGSSVGTTIDGVVVERDLGDGRVEVRILMQTRNALAWAFAIADIDWNDPLLFLNTPLLFGQRAQDVVEGAEPALAHVFLQVVFTHTAELGDPLPDLVQLLNAPTDDQVLTHLVFHATARGPVHDTTGQQPDRPGRLLVQQVCTGDPACVYSAEIVDVRTLGRRGQGEED